MTIRSMKRVAMMLMALAVSGCASVRYNPAGTPMYTYKQPVDLVYLTTLETVDAQPDWMVHMTDKSAGIVEARSVKYETLADLDTQSVRFVVAFVTRTETSLRLDPKHSKCKGDDCRGLLDQVHANIMKLPKREEPDESQS